MRKPIIVGNWKLHKTPHEAFELVKELLDVTKGIDHVEIGIAPTYTALYPIGQMLEGNKLILSSQNVFWETSGAFTGTISAAMLKDCGVTYAIIGHSERRQYFNETNETVNRRVKAAFNEGLSVIACIGESLEEREAEKTLDVLKEQIHQGLKELNLDDPHKLVVAYEPVWAIGTGKVATLEQIAQAHAFIRSQLAELFGSKADEIRIQYGGSVKPENAEDILGLEDVDGALVGGASLKVPSFMGIIEHA